MPVRRKPLRLMAPLTKQEVEAKKKARFLQLFVVVTVAQHLCRFNLAEALQEAKAREGGPAPSRRPRKDARVFCFQWNVASFFCRCQYALVWCM